MDQKQLRWLTIGLAVVPALMTAMFYTRLPSEVPMRWGLDGAVSYGPKFQLWFLAFLPLLLLFLFRALPKIDPRKQNYVKFQSYYDSVCLVMMLFLLSMNVLVVSESLRPGRVSVWRVVTVGVGVLFLFLGNLMPKIRNNFFMGIRTPWTLSDPDVWNRANRLGGQCFFLFGVVTLLSGLLLPETIAFTILMGGAIVSALIPILFSYIWYQKKQKDQIDKGNNQ